MKKQKKELRMGILIDMAIDQLDSDEILIRKVSKLGNSGHISIPSKHIGKQAKVIIRSRRDNEK